MPNFSSYENLKEILESVKSYIDQHTPDNVVYSVSLNGGTVVKPDVSGNVDLTVPMPDLSSYVKTSDKFWLINIYGKENWTFGQLIGDSQADPLATKSYVDAKVPNLTGIIKSVSVNKGTQVGPDANGNADLTINTYTLELDGGSGANITASIDNGDPVSKDSNNNINLNVPDKYIDTVAGWGRVFDNENTPMYNEDGDAIPHTLDIGYIGKPKYYVTVKSKPSFSWPAPSFVLIKVPNHGQVTIYGDDGQVVKFGNNQVREAKGSVFVVQDRNGSLQGGWLIGMPLEFTMQLDSISNYDYVGICTSLDENNNPVYERVTYKSWEKTITAKGFTSADLKKYVNGYIWSYKPTFEFARITYDNNNLFPDMNFDVMTGSWDMDNRTEGFLWLNGHHDANLKAGAWRFKDCYENGMVDENGVAHTWTFRMPYYSTGPSKSNFDPSVKQFVLLDFCLTTSARSRNHSNYHCIIQDAVGNVLFDIKMNEHASADYPYIQNDNMMHVYKRLTYNPFKKTFDVYENADW